MAAPPTKEDLQKLPRWAVVAYATRCALRVVGAFEYFWPTAPEKFINAVKTAVDTSADVQAIQAAAESACAAHYAAEAVNPVIGNRMSRANEAFGERH